MLTIPYLGPNVGKQGRDFDTRKEMWSQWLYDLDIEDFNVPSHAKKIFTETLWRLVQTTKEKWANLGLYTTQKTFSGSLAGDRSPKRRHLMVDAERILKPLSNTISGPTIQTLNSLTYKRII
jgi:hypothetical protein